VKPSTPDGPGLRQITGPVSRGVHPPAAVARTGQSSRRNSITHDGPCYYTKASGPNRRASHAPVVTSHCLMPRKNPSREPGKIARTSPCKQREGWDCSQPSRCLLDSAGIRPVGLERLHVGSLPSLGPFTHVELHGLTFLQALETAGADCRVMHKNVFAVLARR